MEESVDAKEFLQHDVGTSVSISNSAYFGVKASDFEKLSTCTGQVYLDDDYKSETLSSIYNLQIGSIVQLEFNNNTVKTPYVVTEIEVGEQDPHSPSSGYVETEFCVVLRAVNSVANPYIVNGRMRESSRLMKIFLGGAYKITDFEELDHILESGSLVETYSGGGTLFCDATSRVDATPRKLHVLSDGSISELFDFFCNSMVATHI